MKEIKLPVVVTFRVDHPTKLQIDTAAAAQGVAPGILCRRLVVAQIGSLLAQPRLRREVANRDLLREILGELGRQGSLLNQVARGLNSGGALSEAGKDLKTMRATYEAALASLTDILGVGPNA